MIKNTLEKNNKTKQVAYTLAENQLMEDGYTELNLEVWKQNERAIVFYKKQGFVSIGNVDFPMEFNTYENFVMNKKLS